MEENQTSASAGQETSGSVSFPTVNEPKKQSKAKTFLIVGILILMAFLGFVVYRTAVNRNSSTGDTEESVSFDDLTTPSAEFVPTVAPLASPSGTPSAKVDRSKIRIQIQNGTGITGEAAYLQGVLKNLGYTDIKVGNSETNVTATTVTYSTTLDSGVISEVTQKLNSVYQSVTTKTTSSADYDILVVTGLRKGSTAKPSATPTATTKPSATPTASAKPSATPTSTP